MGAERIDSIDWEAVAESLTRSGYARLAHVLSPEECGEIASWYGHPELFRDRIEMARYRFGRGEYQYFRYPLPKLVEDLRERLYERLSPIANHWASMLRGGSEFPATLTGLLEQCHRAGQTRPTPLLLRYGPGDYNCLHQDLYGAIAFPFQVVFSLSERGRDYDGGELLLVENPPRAQAMGRVLTPSQGDALVITNRDRPAAGTRGAYRVRVRHGVSEVTSGQRFTLGIIFHDAE